MRHTSLLPLRPCRYQPGTLTSSSQSEKLVELVEGEKVAVSGGDSGDEYVVELEDRPLRETFSAKLLFCPSGKIPTELSGTIVYATTAIICKSVQSGVERLGCAGTQRLLCPVSPQRL